MKGREKLVFHAARQHVHSEHLQHKERCIYVEFLDTDIYVGSCCNSCKYLAQQHNR